MLEAYQEGLKRLRKRYTGMFGTTDIKRPETLENIIAKIDRYSFIDIDADVKGDAYEYFLRRYNKQKSDLAQHFTPRHIVQAMVTLCNPRWRETVCDPFCGTGGMLIQAFKHIKRHLPENANTKDRDRLRKHTVFGADISRSADTAKMNMILAGDGHSNICQRNSLSTTNDKQYDVVITNIPFGNDELAAARHCLHVAAKEGGSGRVCLIVPERMLDDARDDYVAIRRELAEKWTIKRIVSLPREVFRGITSAKTSIIYAVFGASHRAKAVIPYFEVKDDGYTLDKRRDPLPGLNDIDRLLEDRYAGKLCRKHIANSKNGWAFKPPNDSAHHFRYPQAPLSDLVRVVQRPIHIDRDMNCREPGFIGKSHAMYLREERLGYNVKTTKRFKILPGDLVFSRMHTQDGLFTFSDSEYHGTATHLTCEVDETKIDRHYLFWALDLVVPTLSKMDTTGRETYSAEEILRLQIPLPSLIEQRRLVTKVQEAREALQSADKTLKGSKDRFQTNLFQKEDDG